MASISTPPPSPLVPGTTTGGPTLPTSPSDAESRYLKLMQWLNTAMWHWRNQQGAFVSSNYPDWARMPIPWRDRGQSGSPQDVQATGGNTSSWAARIKEFRRGSSGSGAAARLDNSSAAYDLAADAGAAWSRLQDVQNFFASGYAPMTNMMMPGIGGAAWGRTWIYKRVLGYGGAGLACHYRLQETAENGWDVAVKVSLLGWASEPIRRERRMMQVRYI